MCQMKKFTIIIPHHNIPNLLERCLRSIPKRDDLQVIIIDDNSDPEKVDFENFPGLHEEHVEVIFTKEGKGAGYARNVGIAQANSKWLLFADADDLYSEGFNEFLDKYGDTDADVVYFANINVDTKTMKPVEGGIQISEMIQICMETGNFDLLRYKSDTPWSKMVRMSVIKKYSICYHEIPAGNDVWFSSNIGYYAQHIKLCDKPIYIYTMRNGSIQHTPNKENLLARIHEAYVMNNFLRNIDKLEFYAESWPAFLNLRKVSVWLFAKEIIPYFIKTPKFVLWKHIKYSFKKYFKM